MLAVCKKNHLFKNCIAFFAGCLLPLSLSPFDYSLIIFPSIILLFYSINHLELINNPKQRVKLALLRGYLYGLGCFGCGVAWIYISIHEHGDASPLLAGFLTMLLIFGALAFFPAIKLGLYQYFKSNNSINSNLLILAPSIWVILDWVQSWAFTGFPWLYVGFSQTDTALAGYAPVLSIFGLTWMTVFTAGIIYLLLKNLAVFINNNYHQNSLNSALAYLVVLISVYIIGLSLQGIEWTKPLANSEKIVLVQGDIAQNKRWQKNEVQNTINKYINLTAPYWKHSTIIWPESAIPTPLHTIDNLVADWKQQAVTNDSTLILGIPVLANPEYQYYNGIIALNQKNNNIYFKSKLVPWGEYVPMENIFRGLIAFFDLPMSHFIPGDNMSVLSSEFINWVPFICYEIAYPDYVITNAHLGNAIVTISNDAWFGNSIGPWQHLQLAKMRAIETGRPVVRSTNNGVTAVINHKGKIIQQIHQFAPGVLTQNIYGYNGLTPIMYYGVNFIILLCFVLFILCAIKNNILNESSRS